ncbi:MAG: tetratricopeptide repeat protein [Candidatus Omnitrophica bacterium]|nr:tetratricopeptide repeat protein [Candidatus Omnitrophota bacterium]
MTNDINEKDLKEFYDKGVLALEKKNYDYAVEIFSQIVSSKYDHLEARHYLHLSSKNKAGDTKPSLITNVINYINSFFGALSAELLLKKGNIAGALEKLEKVIASNPNDTKAIKKIADIFYKNNQNYHAIQNLEEVKAIDANDVEALKKLGDLYLRKEDYKNAKSNYETALKIDPGDTEALKALKNLDALGTIQREFKNE